MLGQKRGADEEQQQQQQQQQEAMFGQQQQQHEQEMAMQPAGHPGFKRRMVSFSFLGKLLINT